MATHGAARDATILNLRTLNPFQRRGFAMSLVSGKFNGTGRLQGDTLAEYMSADVTHTVLSYGTPIAWVGTDGSVTVPNVKYSVTTTHHQSLCKVYLNN